MSSRGFLAAGICTFMFRSGKVCCVCLFKRGDLMFLCDPVTPTAGARKANKHFKIGRKSTGSSHSAAPSGQIKNWKQKKSYLLRTLGSCRAEGLQKFHICTVFRHRWSLWGAWAVGMDLSRAHLSLAKLSFPPLLCNPKCHSTPQNTSSRPQLHAVLGKQVINCLLNENELPKKEEWPALWNQTTVIRSAECLPGLTKSTCCS